MKTAMYGLKYGNRRYFAEVFAKDMAKRHARWLAGLGVDMVLPVPMHAAKKRQRGYDQAEELAKALCREAGLPFSGKTLVRTKKTLPQKELNDTDRRKNLKNAFKIPQNSVKSNGVLLVDDIYTTGATIDACAEALKNAGVREVYAMTVVVGQGI